MSPEYHPQTHSGFVLSLSSGPSISVPVLPEAATGATFSTAFSTTAVPVLPSSSAPTVDVQARFVQPLRLILREMTVGGWDRLSDIKQRMAIRCLRNFRSMVIDCLSEVSSVDDFEAVLEVLSGEEGRMRQIGFHLVGYPDVLQRLRDFHAAWAEVEVQTRPKLPVADIRATEEGLHQARCKLVDANDSRSSAQATLADSEGRLAQVSSDCEAADVQIRDLEARLAAVRETRRSLHEQKAKLEAERVSVQQVVEDSMLEASVCESQIAAYNSRLAFLRSTLVPPAPAVLSLFADFKAAVESLHGVFCDLLENVIP